MANGQPSMVHTPPKNLGIKSHVKPKMECLVQSSRERDDQDPGITIIAAKTELTASLVALALDLGELTRSDTYRVGR